MKKILLLCVLFLVGCSGLVKEKDLSLNFDLNSEVSEIIYYSSLAPSGHNAQNWRVELDDDQLNIILDSSRLLHEVDPMGRQSLISIGAFIQNMLYAFDAYGYSTKLEIFDVDHIKNNPVVAQISYKKTSDNLDNKMLILMKKRKTFKGIFDGEVSDALVKKLIGSVELAGNSLYYYSSGSSEFDYIKENSYNAMVAQLNSLQKRKELSKWLRFSDKEALEKSDGLPAEMLGMTGIMKKLYYITTDREDTVKDKFAQQSLDVFTKKLESTKGFFVITGGDTNKEHIITGMYMEKIWLKAAELDISLSVTSQIFEELSQNVMQKDLNLINTPQMIFGTGKAEYGNSLNLRRSINKFVSQKGE